MAPAAGRGARPDLKAPGAPASATTADGGDEPFAELRSGSLGIRARLDPFRLTLVDADGLVLQTQEPPMGVSDADWPAWSVAVEPPGSDRRWFRLTSAAVEARDDTARSLRLRVATDDPGGRVALVDADLRDPAIARVAVRVDPPLGAVRVAAQFTAPADEHYFGFGSHADTVDFRGRRVVNILADRLEATGGVPTGDPDSLGTYAAIPFWLTNRGYGVLLTRDSPSTCDMASARADTVRVEVQAGALAYAALYGPRPLDVLGRFADVAGHPPMPPPWTFGVWKTAIGGAGAVLSQARRLRALGIPASALYCYDAVDGASNLGWPQPMYAGAPPGAYPDVAALSAALHALGFKVMGYLNCLFRPGTSAFRDGNANGYLLKAKDGTTSVDPAMPVAFLDVTNPQAVSWWQGLLRRILVDLDVDGWMQDFGDTAPIDAAYADGSDPLAMHNRYPVPYAKAAHEEAARHKPDAVFLMRSGCTGAQPYQRAVWPGDQVDSWDARWGFPAAVRAGINEGICGMPFWGSDIGGYVQGPGPPALEKELWIRWVQFGAFSPVMRDLLGRKPTGTPVDLWTDDETVAIFRTYARMHLSLFPYLYGLARVAHETGAPLLRHLALAYPDDPMVYGIDDEYLLGDTFLVAPVVAPQSSSRRVYLPAGDWVDFWSRAPAPGGRWVDRPTPLDQIPVYVRAGAIVPTLPDGVQTLAPPADPATPAARADFPALRVEVYPHPSAAGPLATSFGLHDGTTLEYRAETGGGLRIEGGPATRRYVATLPVASPPSQVILSGRALPFFPGLGAAAPDSGAWDFDSARSVLLTAFTVPGAEPLGLAWTREI